MRLLLLCLAACGTPDPAPVLARDAGPAPVFRVRDPEMKDVVLTTLTRDTRKRFERYTADPANGLAKIETCATFLAWQEPAGYRLGAECIDRLAATIASPSPLRTNVIAALADHAVTADAASAKALRTLVWQTGDGIDPALASRLVTASRAESSAWLAATSLLPAIPPIAGIPLLPDVQAYTLEILARPGDPELYGDQLREAAFEAAPHIADQSLVCEALRPQLALFESIAYVADGHCDELVAAAYERLLMISDESRSQQLWFTFMEHRQVPARIRARAAKRLVAELGDTSLDAALIARLRGR